MKNLLFFLILLCPLFSFGGIRYVTVSGAGNKDGSSWANAYDGEKLQKAINDFNTSTGYDTVWVAKGTYFPTEIFDTRWHEGDPRAQSFIMHSRVSIFGGFAGTEKFLDQRRQFGVGCVNETILSGDLGTPGNKADNSYHVVYAGNGKSNVIIDGFTISAGNSNNSSVNSGGGLYSNNFSSLTIKNVTFKDNYCSLFGGALYTVYSESFVLVNVAFISNKADKEGGAIYITGYKNPWNSLSRKICNINITNATFAFNEGENLIKCMYNGTILNNCIISESNNAIVQMGGNLSVNYCCLPVNSNLIKLEDAAVLSGMQNIHADPLFVKVDTINKQNSDIRIMGHSPCVNAGNNGYNSTFNDIRGIMPRVQHNTIDIGAYEYTDYVDPIKGPFYVLGDSRGNDSNMGTSWATAKNTLQAALDLVRIPGRKEEIWVSYGIYYPSKFRGIDQGRYNTFELDTNLTIYGGFYGNETSPDQRSYFRYGEPLQTILSGDIGVRGDNSDNCYHVVFNPGSTMGGLWPPSPGNGVDLDSTAVLDGFTITGGNANDSWNFLSDGAGMYNYGCSPLLRNLTFVSNSSLLAGGGMYNRNSSPKLEQVIFLSNSSVIGGGMVNYNSSPVIEDGKFISNVSRDNYGGGMANFSSSLTLTNTSFESNTASYGGGMSNDNSSPSFTNCTFNTNQSVMDGGAIFNDHNSNPSLSSVTFTSNSAGVYGGAISNSNTSNPVLTHVQFTSNSAGKGGAISNSGGSQTIVNGTFVSNTASESGGAIYNWGASPTISCSKFSSNTAVDDGGAIYNYMDANPVLTNDTIVLNQAGRYGGGIANYTSSPALTNVAVLSNTATNSGGGLHNTQGSNPILVNNTLVNNKAKFGGGICNSESSPILNNSIVWGNSHTTGGAGRQFYLYQGTTTLNYSCFPNTDYDVFNNGATFATTNHNINLNPHLVDINGNDPRILGSSPCKNNGLNTYNTTALDLPGRTRIQETIIDMGACEFSEGDPQVAIIYVDASRPNDSGDGKSWATAKKTLQAALDRADGGYQIWVKKGTYYPDKHIEGLPVYFNALTFQLKNDLAIYGGFVGTETSVNARRNFGHGEANETLISGDVGTVGEAWDNCFHLFYHPASLGLDSTAILDGFTIQGGNADGDAPHNLGGAMYNAAASPTIRNVAFLSNSADSCGGALFNFGSSPGLTNVIFSSGAAASGGAIYNEASSPVLTNVTFSENNATSDGGAIFNYFASNPVLNNCILWGNNAGRYGNQVYLYSGTMDLNYSCFPDGANDMAGLSAYSGTNNLPSNPQFVNAAGNDVRILGGSPCKDSGWNGYNSLSTDVRGQVRIQNSTIDRGAYEFTNGMDPLVGMLYVDAAQPDDTQDGRSWATAKKTLGAALAIAGGGYEIRVKAGTYVPTTGTDRTLSFAMKNDLKIYGGFSGAAGEDIDTRTDFCVGGIHETILSGDIGTPGDYTDNSYHLFYHPKGTNLDSSAVLDGFTIQNGNADDYDDHSRGGGMFNYQSSPTIRNVTFLSNNAFSEGGAIYNCYFSSPAVSNTLIYSNSANYGGGVANDTVSGPVFTNATIVYNNSVQGGGLFNGWGSRPVLNNCIVWGNTVVDLGKQFYSEEHCFPYLNYSCYPNETNDVYGTLYDDLSSSINSNPLFLDTLGNNYLLYGNSPCVGAGNNEYNEAFADLRGQLRIQNGAIDMGAYEWTDQYDPADKILFVDASKPDDNGNGYSWATAKKQVQSAIDIAREGYQIWVKKGTYYPTKEIGGTGDRFRSFEMKDNVGIYGGFAGNEDPSSFDLDNRNFEINETVLSGDIGVFDDPSDNCYHVFNHPDGSEFHPAAQLDGFTITGGNANGDAPHNAGGGMYNSGSWATLSHLTFTSNSAVLGGGMYNVASVPAINNSLFASNTAVSDGGGMYNTSSFPTLTNVTLTANSAQNGGGIFNTDSYSTTLLKNSILWGNQASVQGNQLYLESGSGMFQYTCYANATNDLFVHPDATFDAFTFCSDSDPMFTDPANNDFTLFANSPCINSGNNDDNAVRTDIRGQGRIQNETIDMGAYEWTSGTDPGAAILYVDAAKADDTGDGLSWSTAKKTLQAALDRSVGGFEIWVKAGTYYPTKETGGTGDRYTTFALKDGVSLYGGFYGNERSINEREYYGFGQPLETILSGDIGTKSDPSDNSYHVVRLVSGTSALDGFTITGGNASGTGSDGMGGGLLNEGDLVNLNNVAMVSNSSIDGGGLYASGYGNYTNCFIIGNTASGSGGGVFVHPDNTLINCLIIDNTANNGGGAYAHSGGHFINCTFSGDSASTNGGGVFADSGGRFTSCIFWGNPNDEIFTLGTGMDFLNCAIMDGYTGEGAGEGNYALTVNPFQSSTDFSLNTLPGGGELCLNTGNDQFFSHFDLAGNPRNIGGVDIGAYEYTGCVDHYLVRTDASSGPGSLSWAINVVCDGATISFDSSKTIVLEEPLWLGSKSLTIESNGWDIVLDGNEQVTVMFINGESDRTYSLNGLTIRNGQSFSGSGGGLNAWLESGTLTVNNCIFAENISDWQGGGANISGNATFTSCIFSGNTAVSGGGVSVSAGSIFINCQFSNNTAASVDLIPSGGGAYITDDGTFINCTFSGNYSETGGGISLWDQGTITNCLFWDNGSSEIATVYGGSFSHCAAPDGYLGTDNGNVILSSSPFAGASDFRPDKSTPGGITCFNAGLNSVNTTVTDLRGMKRIQIDTIDIGAYEWTLGTDPGTHVFQNLALADRIIFPGEDKCFNAYDTLTVAGSGNYVVVTAGSSANFIAGKSIRFLPGFFADSASYVHASITTDGSFCDMAAAEATSPVLWEEKSTNINHAVANGFTTPAELDACIYPNPNTGRFTITLNETKAGTSVRVYTIRGVKVLQLPIQNMNVMDVELPNPKAGIYFVQITIQNQVCTKKILVK